MKKEIYINLKVPYSKELEEEYIEFFDLDSMTYEEKYALPTSLLYKYFIELQNEKDLENITAFDKILYHLFETNHKGRDSFFELITNFYNDSYDYDLITHQYQQDYEEIITYLLR